MFAGPTVAPHAGCKHTCAADQGKRAARGGAVSGDRSLVQPGVRTTRQWGHNLSDGICSLMARGSAWMHLCFVVAASLGVAPRFVVLLACQAVPQVRMPEAVDFKTLWATCKDPRNAFTATSPNGALYHVMALSDQGFTVVGICVVYIAALLLLHPRLGSSRRGRLVSQGCQCCACLDARALPCESCLVRSAHQHARSATSLLLLQSHAWQDAHCVVLGTGTCLVDWMLRNAGGDAHRGHSGRSGRGAI